MSKNETKATVQKVIPNGKHGPFAIATSKNLEGSITFSLEPTVWREKDWPEEGAIILLTKLRKKRAGWRAKQGRHWVVSDEQTAYKEKAMKNLKTFVAGLRKKFFPLEEDKAWKQWVDFKDRKARDLIEILSSDVKDGFKKRALFLLIVPSADFNTLYWKQYIGKFSNGTDFLEALTTDQLDYVVDLIVEFCSVLRPGHTGKTKYSVTGGGGMTVYTPVTEKYHDALYFYNRCIYYLLTVPEKDAEKVFPLFSLIDISTYSNMEDASGYNPFRNLLRMEIDEKWKKMADDRMRCIITDEVTGKTAPRKEWEEALVQYANIIQLQLFSEIKYSLELFASQIQFIMDNRQHKTNLISSYQVIRLFNLLSGDEYKELRHTIARYSLLEDTGGYSRFTIYDGETRQAADYILKEFGDDHELVDKIRELEEEREKKQAENEAYQAKQRAAEKEKKATEDDILAQMK